MRLDSIKSRLALMTCICVLGMGLMVASQHYFTQRLVRINQQQTLLLRLGQDLLQMRRHEKDFLLRHQHNYAELFNQRSAVFIDRLRELRPLFADYSLPIARAQDLAARQQSYQHLFQRVVKVQTKIGLTASKGLSGELANLEARLLRHAEFAEGTRQRVKLDTVRLNIRNFFLSRDMFFADKVSESLAKLPDVADTAATGQSLTESYRTTFLALTDNYQKLGLTHNDGLRGEFRRQAHAVESALQGIDSALKPIINKRLKSARIYSSVIAVLTSLALVLLMLKSFATFQKAFGNFVMFFYRCKRQYQKIDARKLGFAEFKSLAQLANEMVESRQAIELRLAAEEQLSANRRNE